jgi:hypothetical protein
MTGATRTRATSTQPYAHHANLRLRQAESATLNIVLLLMRFVLMLPALLQGPSPQPPCQALTA